MAEEHDMLGERECIAIIGLTGRFPGADNVTEFWQNLCDGKESITIYTPEELIELGRSPAIVHMPTYVRARPRINNVDKFDAAFFDLAPREVEIIDPQQRLFLECCWEALEEAGYDPETCDEWIGVFGGVGQNTYYDYNLRSNADLLDVVGGTLQVMVGNERDYLTTRVSYKLNLKGPSFDVQSACSTSLVATHLACLNLLNYHCDMALAGGVYAVTEKEGYYYKEGGILSPDGHCRPFDIKAQGTIFGDGVGVVVLKRLSEALRDRDHIYAVIKGSAITNDGAAKAGFAAPGIDGQKRAVAMALQGANIDVETISYIEAHGTGTSLGDPIEVEALTQVFRAYTNKKQFCAIGSVKGNVGHLDAAAGVTGLIKTTLALKHKQLPPSINFETPNPRIDFANSPFYVNTKLREWTGNGQPRRAGVSSFGIGGTNAHIVLEEAPETEPSSESRRYQVMGLSARTETALEVMTDNLVAHLRANPSLNLADVAYTLQVGRRAFEKRRAIVCKTLADATTGLQERDPTRVLTSTSVLSDRPIAFMFSGQGAQYVGMGRDLYQREPLFREQVDVCATLLKPHLGLDLREVLYPKQMTVEQATAQLDQTWLTQPALFVIEYALSRLWMAWGIEPAAMIGHSIGEYTAACLAGVFRLEDALALVAARGRLMQSMPPGAMLSVPLTEAEIQPVLGTSLTLATINGPERCVVAGPIEAIMALEQQLVSKGIAARRLHTSHAFHSSMMDPILKPFEEQVRQIQLCEPQIPFISNVTGAWIKANEATDPAYWARHLRQPVRFSSGLSVLAQSAGQVLLEVGPGRTLCTLAKRHPDRTPEQVVLSSIRHVQDVEDDDSFLLRTLGHLWLAGVHVNWPALYSNEQRLRLSLPTYPFERQRYLIEIRKDDPSARSRADITFKAPNIADWFYIPSWKCSMPPVLKAVEAVGRYLVFSDGSSLSAGLEQLLRARGHDVAVVLAGDQFAANSDIYTIRPSQRGDYVAVLASLAEQNRPPTHIVYLWSAPPIDESVPGWSDKALQSSFYSLLSLAQAIGAQNLDTDFQLAVLSSNMQSVYPDEVIQPEKATLLGPCLVMSQEMANVTTRSIDLVLPPAGSDREAHLIEQIIAELEAGRDDPVIAYRGYNRLVRAYEQISLTELGEGETGRLRNGGVYLITGGLGGIGLTLAEYLAKTVQAKLVLTSHSRLPTREAWEQWLATHDPQDRTSLRIQSVQALEMAGVEVLVMQADVTDLSQMRNAVNSACERFGAIHGVIHAAGVPGGGVIQLKSTQAADHVLRSKLYGTRVLESVLQDMPLDFMILCSSVTALTGGIGQVDYCAANAFMDAFAQAKYGRNDKLTVSINWDAWGQVGMAATTAPTYTDTRTTSSVQMTPIDHPLFTGVSRETDHLTTFQMVFNPAEHWVLSDHVILGIPTVPGTTYLELARMAFTHLTQSTHMAVPEILFFVPLRVSKGDSKEAQMILEELADGFSFYVRSKAGVTPKGEAKWEMHATGKLIPLADSTPQHFDIEAIQARCPAFAIRKEGASYTARQDFVKFGPRWNNLFRDIRVGQDEALVLLELDQEFVHDVESYALHPSLLDMATSFVVSIAGGLPYLPMSYKNMRIYRNLPSRFYSYIRRSQEPTSEGKTITAQVTLLDEQGDVLVDIQEFTMAQVDESAAARLRASTGSESHAQPETAMAASTQHSYALDSAILPHEGVEAFRRILFHNQLPQVAVVTRHLPTLIQQASELTQERLAQEVTLHERRVTKHPRPNLSTPYVAPRDEQEKQLAAFWQDILGVKEVGIYDNFFEMGGDSVLVVQVVARAKTTGLQLSPAQVFEHPTIAALATLLRDQSVNQ